MMGLVLNDLETRRFGVVCARIDGRAAHFPDLSAINREAKARGVGMISTRVDACALDRVHALENDGYRLMDTLVYYGRSLRDLLPPRPLPEGVSIRLAIPDDVTAIETIARLGFHGYFGHYHADPRMDNAAADAAYVEWAASSIQRTDASTPALVAQKNGEIVGFAILRFDVSGECEIVLNAVHPSYQGKGFYASLVERAMNLSVEHYISRIFTSTQINNYTVQRVWSRLGFVHQHSCYTFHKWISEK